MEEDEVCAECDKRESERFRVLGEIGASCRSSGVWLVEICVKILERNVKVYKDGGLVYLLAESSIVAMIPRIGC